MNQLFQQRKWNWRLHCVEIIIVLLLNDEVDETWFHIIVLDRRVQTVIYHFYLRFVVYYKIVGHS